MRHQASTGNKFINEDMVWPEKWLVDWLIDNIISAGNKVTSLGTRKGFFVHCWIRMTPRIRIPRATAHQPVDQLLDPIRQQLWIDGREEFKQ